MPTFAFVRAPPLLTQQILRTYNAPLPVILLPHGFGSMLMPVYYPCETARLVSCYALFK